MMKQTVRNLESVILLAFFAMVNVSAQDVLKVKETQLSNGMTVLLNEDHSQPKVFGAVVVRAGGKDSPNTGIAHYFEHIMFKGTDRIGTVDYEKEKVWLDSIAAQYDLLSQTKDDVQRMDIQKKINQLSREAAKYAIPNEFNRLISLYGGTGLNAYTSQDETVFHNSFSSQFMEQWCWLNSERLMKPVFRLFQGELETVYEEKNRSADNMMRQVMDKAMEVLFKDQPYAYPIIGSTENLKNPKLSEMDAFFKKYYVGQNMGLVLCGDFGADSIMPLLERTFGRIPKGEKPSRVPSPMPDITDNPTVKILLPIPIISGEALAWKGITMQHPDKPALDMATRLLTNGSAGMLDSLMNEKELLATLSMSFDFNDAGILGALIIPNLLGSKKKAEQKVMQQIERLKAGDFSEETLETIRLQLMKATQTSLETMESRSELMVSALSKGITWQQQLDQIEKTRKVGKADIVRVANKYFNDHFIRLVKKMGHYPKDNLRQPGYKPVIPQNIDKESAFAQQLKSIPVSGKEVKLVDFDRDADAHKLTEYSTLYMVKNPVNELFNLEIILHRGSLGDPRLDLASTYVDKLGTDSLSRQQLESALMKLGASMSIEVASTTTTLKLSGWDKNLVPSLRLFSHFLCRMKPDAKAMKEIKKTVKVEYKSFGEDNSDVMSAVFKKVMYGNRSENLRQPSVDEVKAMGDNELIDVLREAMKSKTSIVYSGTLPTDRVKAALDGVLPVSAATEKADDGFVAYEKYDQPMVFVYPMPKSRQTLLGTYDLCPPSAEQKDRARQLVCSNYFGDGMSSVLFQEIREFRSMAYSASAGLRAYSRVLHPTSPTVFYSLVGTQADKTMRALGTVDSLLRHVPLREQNMAAAKQEYINEMNESYPSFRGMGKYIARNKALGIQENQLIGYERLVRNLTVDDVKQFFETEVTGKQRVYFLVGDTKHMDMERLAQYGKVVMLKKEDVIR